MKYTPRQERSKVLCAYDYSCTTLSNSYSKADPQGDDGVEMHVPSGPIPWLCIICYVWYTRGGSLQKPFSPTQRVAG